MSRYIFVGENFVISYKRKNRWPKPNMKFSIFSLLSIDRCFKLSLHAILSLWSGGAGSGRIEGIKSEDLPCVGKRQERDGETVKGGLFLFKNDCQVVSWLKQLFWRARVRHFGYILTSVCGLGFKYMAVLSKLKIYYYASWMLMFTNCLGSNVWTAFFCLVLFGGVIVAFSIHCLGFPLSFLLQHFCAF